MDIFLPLGEIISLLVTSMVKALIIERPNTRYFFRPGSGYFRVQIPRVRVRTRVQNTSNFTKEKLSTFKGKDARSHNSPFWPAKLCKIKLNSIFVILWMHPVLILPQNWTKNWSVFGHFYCNFGPIWTRTRLIFGFGSGSRLWTRVPGSQTRGWTH